MDNQSKFLELLQLDVNSKTDKKGKLTYLPWAWAWAEFKKVYPEATYQVIKTDGKPYIYDENLGYMVETSVTAGGLTHSMWLFPMNGANKSMNSESYEHSTKYGKQVVEKATMFDINKALMRCFVKNLAMFGLGLYIYAGEDLPEVSEEETLRLEKEALKLKEVAETKRLVDNQKSLLTILQKFEDKFSDANLPENEVDGKFKELKEYLKKMGLLNTYSEKLVLSLYEKFK